MLGLTQQHSRVSVSDLKKGIVVRFSCFRSSMLYWLNLPLLNRERQKFRAILITRMWAHLARVQTSCEIVSGIFSAINVIPLMQLSVLPNFIETCRDPGFEPARWVVDLSQDDGRIGKAKYLVDCIRRLLEYGLDQTDT